MQFNNNTLTCSQCPFARHLGGNRYACSSWGDVHFDQGVVKGHWQANDDCWEELEKAKDKTDGYDKHFLSDRETPLGKTLRSEVNQDALAWFTDWQNNSQWQQAQQELDEYTMLQSEAAASQDYARQESIKFQVKPDIISEILVWDKQPNGKLIGRAYYSKRYRCFIATRNRYQSCLEAKTLIEAIHPLIKQHRRDQKGALEAILDYC